MALKIAVELTRLSTFSWAHPEGVSNPAARAVTSGLARQSKSAVDRVVPHVERDLTGLWEEKHCHLRRLGEYDAGLRAITARLR